MAKDRKTRRLPLVLSMAATVAAGAAAVYYRRQIDEHNQNFLQVPPELLREVREEGLTLVYWINESGEQCFKTIDESGS